MNTEEEDFAARGSSDSPLYAARAEMIRSWLTPQALMWRALEDLGGAIMEGEPDGD